MSSRSALAVISEVAPARFDALASSAVGSLVDDAYATAGRGWCIGRRVLEACGPPMGHGKINEGARTVADFREHMLAHAEMCKVAHLVPERSVLDKMRAAAALIPAGEERGLAWTTAYMLTTRGLTSDEAIRAVRQARARHPAGLVRASALDSLWADPAHPASEEYDEVPQPALAPPGFVFIYFMGTEDGAEVKLGQTRHPTHIRRKQHEISNGREEPLRTLAAVLGTPADEKALKRHFKDYTSRERSGEWIHAGLIMRDYLRFLRDLPFVARSEDPDELTRLQIVSADQWLPGEGRRKGTAQLRLAEDDPWGDIYNPEPGGGDFYTSPKFIEPARECMGSIDLDPASCREANDVVKARRFYTERDNGLLHEWAGNVWLNPPFGLWSGGWAPKALEEIRSGRVEQMCLLLSSRSSTDKAVHPLIHRCDALLITHGRIPFWGPKATSSPDDGHLVLYFGTRPDKFSAAYRHVGTVKFKPVVGADTSLASDEGAA